MSKFTLFRIEHKREKVGPFRSSIEVNDYVNSSLPTVTAENFNSPPCDIDWACSCISLSQLLKWFPLKHWKSLHCLGFELQQLVVEQRAFFTPVVFSQKSSITPEREIIKDPNINIFSDPVQHSVFFGKHQVIFFRDSVLSAVSYPLTEETLNTIDPFLNQDLLDPINF